MTRDRDGGVLARDRKDETSRASELARDGASLGILIVDDNPQFLAAAVSWIETRPEFRAVGTAQDGEDALRLLATTRVDLVLMDAFMPGLDGFDTTRRIKSVARAPHVVMLSVHHGSEIENEAWAAGADAFLSKSDFTRRLPGLIRSLLEPERGTDRSGPRRSDAPPRGDSPSSESDGA